MAHLIPGALYARMAHLIFGVVCAKLTDPLLVGLLEQINKITYT